MRGGLASFFSYVHLEKRVRSDRARRHVRLGHVWRREGCDTAGHFLPFLSA